MPALSATAVELQPSERIDGDVDDRLSAPWLATESGKRRRDHRLQ